MGSFELAGPVEISIPGSVVLGVLLVVFLLPMTAYALTYFHYRKRARQDPDGPWPAGRAMAAFAIVAFVQIVVTWLLLLAL
jgi:sterol desaturase/sphingolipid hydroxylase (fatty acid hydroxylase superfamily)